MGKSRDTSTAAADIDANTADIDANAAAITALDSAKANYTYSASAPVSPATGDQWMDASGASPKGKVWNGSEWKLFSGASAATFDEGASTGATFYTLTDPDGDGKNYRCAEFLSNGTLIIASTGFVQMWMGASGQNGYNSGQSAVFGTGGNYGGVMEVRGVLAENGTFTVHVGDPSALGAGGVDPSKVTGPFSGFNNVACGTYQWSSGSTYAYRGYPQTLPTVDFNSPPLAYYTVGTAGGGAQAGRPGYGGNGGGGGGGAAGTVTGWTTTPFLWGQGGGGSYDTSQQPANSGNGGVGSQLTAFGKGGTGRVYVRVEL